MGRADLHIHTTVSDGLYDIGDVLDHIAQIGTLDVIAITDHDRVDAAQWAYHHRDRYPFDIIPGTEVTNKDGHILGLWVQEPIPNDLPYRDTVAAIHAQGGMAIFAHPYHIEIDDVRRSCLRYTRQPEILRNAGFDAIEGFNATSYIPGVNMAARWLARRIDTPITGGSDAHTLNSINRGITLFDGNTADDLRTAIGNGTTRVEGRRWHLWDAYRFVSHKPSNKKPALEMDAL